MIPQLKKKNEIKTLILLFLIMASSQNSINDNSVLMTKAYKRSLTVLLDWSTYIKKYI